MIPLITVLIVLACLILAFFVLIQSPKGGGLTGNFGSISSQVMGVKQSADVMEKGTWSAMGVIAALCIVTIMFVSRPANADRAANGKQKSGASAQKTPAATPAASSAPAAPKK